MHIILIKMCHMEDVYLDGCHKNKSENLCSIPLKLNYVDFCKCKFNQRLKLNPQNWPKLKICLKN